MTPPITKRLSLKQLLTEEQLKKLEALQEEYGKFFFSIDDILSKLTGDAEITPEASEFQEKREILKQSIAKNLELYPHNEYDPEVHAQYTQNPLAYWREELKNYDIVLQDIQNIHCQKIQISKLRDLLLNDIKKKNEELQKKENEKMHIIDRQSHDEKIAKIKSQIEKAQQDVETLKAIHAAIDTSPLYKQHYKLYSALNLDRGISVRNIDFVSSCNENNETTNCKDAIEAIYKAYTKQAGLENTYNTYDINTWYKEIYEASTLGSIVSEVITKEIEKQMAAIEQGNEPSTFNKEMKGLSLTQEVPNSKGNLAK